MTSTDWIAALSELEKTIYREVIQDILDLGMSLNQAAAELDCDHKSVREWRDGDNKPNMLNGIKLLALRHALRTRSAQTTA